MLMQARGISKEAAMSNDNTRKWAQDQQKREAAERRLSSDYVTCLHCGNRFPASQGVVTDEAALCPACDSRG